jgi:hypothetical protein
VIGRADHRAIFIGLSSATRFRSFLAHIVAALLHSNDRAGPYPSLTRVFYPQNAAFFEWTMLGSNQKSSPCMGEEERFRVLPSVAQPAYVKRFPASL